MDSHSTPAAEEDANERRDRRALPAAEAGSRGGRWRGGGGAYAERGKNEGDELLSGLKASASTELVWGRNRAYKKRRCRTFWVTNLFFSYKVLASFKSTFLLSESR